MGQTDVVLQASDSAFRTPADLFAEIFWAFVILGTAVGVVVIGYTLYNSYKYREGSGKGAKADVDRPQVGELPKGSGGGKKLALSFSLSAVIVVGLIIWTYMSLLYVEEPPDAEETMEIDVVGYQFGWQFEYPNGAVTRELHAPADNLVWLNVTSRDVFHNFGIPGLRAKSDAIPGMTSRTWFYAEQPANHTVRCYELCGAGHSDMTADVVIHDESSFEEWYATQNASAGGNGTANGTANGTVADGGNESSAIDGPGAAIETIGSGSSHSIAAAFAPGESA